MADITAIPEKSKKGKFLLPSLAIARFAVSPPSIASGLLLIDIAATFGQPVGIMGQMRARTFSITTGIRLNPS